MRENHDQRKHRAGKILAELKHAYPDATCSLDYANPWQLLVATILSAQCTDVRVNMVTPKLFRQYPDPAAMAAAPIAAIEKLIASTGFYHNKAKALQAASADIVAKHAGKVPDTIDALVALHGVGRKTANVVLGNASGKPAGVVVDTHVGRVSQRLALTRQTNPEKIEQDLAKLIPQDDWTLFSHLLIAHGRKLCAARNPRCEACPLRPDCPAADTILAERQRAATKKPPARVVFRADGIVSEPRP